MNEEEKKRLNELGGKILREARLDFETWKDYDWIRKETGDVGYANYYLVKSNDEIDKDVYAKLVELDTKLGTTSSEQLFSCVFYTLNLDIIKV